MLIPPHRDVVDRAFQEAFPNITFCKARSCEDLARELPSCQVLLINNSLYTPEVSRLAARHAPKLRWIQFTTVGIDTAFRRGLPPGVMITNMRGVRTEILASHVMALMLGVMRGFRHFETFRAQKQWTRDGMSPFLRALEETTLVIVGLGGIGRNVARKAKAFDMHVIGVSRHGRANASVDRVVSQKRFREVLPEADVLVLSLPLVTQTHHLLGKKELACMKSGAIVINIARGGLIDEAALIDALKHGRLGGAGLDVVESEPLAPENPLWEMDNVLLTPHIGGRGGVAQDRRFAALLAENLHRFQNGQPLRNAVDPDTGLVHKSPDSSFEFPIIGDYDSAR
jgi:phosphoglycerate dehydrogenase-like enzyme